MGQENFQVAGIQGTTRIGVAQEKLRIAGEYLAAVNARSLHSVGKTLHPDLHFMGPTGEVRGRERFLENFHTVFADLEKLDMTGEALSDNLVFFKYYMVAPAPPGRIQGTMKTTHSEDGLIKKIEMATHSSRPENDLRPNSNPGARTMA
jgi:hypothetical protein